MQVLHSKEKVIYREKSTAHVWQIYLVICDHQGFDRLHSNLCILVLRYQGWYKWLKYLKKIIKEHFEKTSDLKWKKNYVPSQMSILYDPHVLVSMSGNGFRSGQCVVTWGWALSGTMRSQGPLHHIWQWVEGFPPDE